MAEATWRRGEFIWVYGSRSLESVTVGRKVAGMAAGAEAVGSHLNLKHKTGRVQCVWLRNLKKIAPGFRLPPAKLRLLKLPSDRAKDQVFKYLRPYRNIHIPTTTSLNPLSLWLPLGYLLRDLYIRIKVESLVQPLDLVVFFVTTF